MSDALERELERRADAGEPSGTRALIEVLARRGMFFICDECGAVVPPMARDRHEYEHEYHRHLEAETERIAEGLRQREEAYRAAAAEAKRLSSKGGTPIVPLPPPDPGIGARPRNEPLFHRMVITPEDGLVIRFFASAVRGQHSSLGSMVGLPPGSHFYAHGLSLIPDEEAPRESLQGILNEGRVWFLIGGSAANQSPPSCINNDMPARITFSERLFFAKEVMADELAGLVPVHRLSVHGLPVELPALMTFGVTLYLRNPVPEPIGVLCVLHGLRLTGVTG